MEWLGEWLRSPGFGGVAAVCAAGIAWIGVRHSVAAQQAAARGDQRWDRLKWAVDMVLSGKETASVASLTALDAITDVPVAKGEDEGDRFARRITEVFLEGAAQGILEEGDPDVEVSDDDDEE